MTLPELESLLEAASDDMVTCIHGALKRLMESGYRLDSAYWNLVQAEMTYRRMYPREP